MGYPISYGIAKLLLEKGKMDLESIAKAVERSKPAVCYQLTKLRLAHIVRYGRAGRSTTYRIKYPHDLKKLLETCESLAKRASRRLDKDF